MAALRRPGRREAATVPAPATPHWENDALLKKVISILIGLGILAALYWRVDLGLLARAFSRCRPWWIVGSLAMLAPTIVLMAARFRMLVPGGGVSLADAASLALAAGVLNMVLPSRMGDLAKSYFMARHCRVSGSLALALVVFERACDLLSLLAWCVFGLLMFRHRTGLLVALAVPVVLAAALLLLLIGWPAFARGSFRLIGRIASGRLHDRMRRMSVAWEQMHGFFWADKFRLAQVAGTSVLIWLMHLAQIWLLILGLRGDVRLLTSMGLTPMAMLAGLFPLTFAGIGTRDAALVFFYAPSLGEARAAALGVLCTLRHLVLAVAGLPFIGRYLLAAGTAELTESGSEG